MELFSQNTLFLTVPIKCLTNVIFRVLNFLTAKKLNNIFNIIITIPCYLKNTKQLNVVKIQL